jgi:hypothetical protein
MKSINISLFVALLLLLNSNKIYSQHKFQSPSEGKSVIYFMRTTSLGAIMNFRFFDGKKYLGKFKDKNYFRYECEPGKHLFWVKAENIDYLEANLLAGKVYIVESNSVMGAFSSGVKFNILDFNDSRKMKRVFKLMNKKEPLVFDRKELLEDQNEMQDIIKGGLEKYENKQDRDKDFKEITPQMFYTIPE